MTIKALLIGESWGEREQRWQHPFVGAAGVELARMLGQSGLGPELLLKRPNELDMINYWKHAEAHFGLGVTNVFNDHPAGNNLLLYFTNAKEGEKSLPPLKQGKYLRPELLFHLQRLWQEIENLRPNLIITLGNTPSWAVLSDPKTMISQIRGTLRVAERFGIKVLPTYHPSAVLHQWPLRPTVLADFTKCKKEIETKDIKRTERWITVYPTFEEIIAWSRLPADYYAVDIESGRALFTKAELKAMTPAMNGILNRQISMIGFARNANDALVIPIMSRKFEDLNYWRNPADEVMALLLIQRLLSSPAAKIFQNGMYDIPMLLSYGLKPRHCDHDTMLLHHSIYPESPKSLGFLGSVYGNEQSWKQMYAGGESVNLKKDD